MLTLGVLLLSTTLSTVGLDGPAPPPPPAPVSAPPAAAPLPAAPLPRPAPQLIPPLAPPSVELVPTKVWYGWEGLLVDIASLGVLASHPDPAVADLAIGGLVLGTPIAHLANRQIGTGLLSLAVRGLVVASIYGLLHPTSSCPPMQSSVSCGVQDVAGAFIGIGFAVGLSIGGLVFAGIDDSVLATKVEMRSPEVLRNPTPAVTVKPRLGLSAGGVQLGLLGSF